MAEYRNAARRCPSCSVVMEVHSLAHAEVDVCPDCRGAFIDWMDGDIAGISQALARRVRRVAVDPPPSRADEVLSCAACSAALTVDHLGANALPIWRCPECVGCFVEANIIHALNADPGKQSDDSDNVLSRLLDRVRQLFLGT